MTLKTIILAAGQGTRMRSKLPKVLHPIAGKPMLEHVYEMAGLISDNHIAIVFGHEGAQLKKRLAHLNASWYEQAEQLGTGHAVEQAIDHVDDADLVLILYGDVPLLDVRTVESLIQAKSSSGIALLTVVLENPQGYGRIVRDEHNHVISIVEEKDANDEERLIKETNTGVMVLNGADLKLWITRLENNNAQNEFYLTDLIALAVAEGLNVKTVQPENEYEVAGVNTRAQLAALERIYQSNQAQSLMARGVSFADPQRFDLRGTVEPCGQDVWIDVNVVLEGQVSIADGVRIGSNCWLKNVTIESNATIEANSVLEDAHVGPNCTVGPFARLRPGTKLADGVRVGNFVEVKKSTIGPHSKVNHLSYVGDAIIGRDVNVGAGTITCNYDGANKFQTTIEDGAFIGSDTQLVAPVTVGRNATIGAGSTITRNAPENRLTLTRSKQITVPGWKRPEKEK